MPDLPISGLPALTTPEPTDVFAIVNGGITKKTTVQSVGTAVFNQISSSVLLISQTGSFVTTSSFNSFTQSINNFTASVNATTASLTAYYGSFFHTASMTLALANTAYTMSFNTTDISKGVSISGSYNDIIKITNPGIYNIQFSAQLDKTDSQNATAYIWLSRTGSDVDQTNTGVTLGGGAGDSSVAAWNFFVSASANDWYQLKWGATRDNARILYNPTPPIGPAIPSIILTVNKVG
jgi:hypothetical protein